MADLLQLQHHLSQAVDEIATLPIEHWECWFIQFLTDLDKKAVTQDQQDEFRALLVTLSEDIAKRLGDRRS